MTPREHVEAILTLLGDDPPPADPRRPHPLGCRCTRCHQAEEELRQRERAMRCTCEGPCVCDQPIGYRVRPHTVSLEREQLTRFQLLEIDP